MTSPQSRHWPIGLRSPEVEWRQVGIWRPLIAVLAALFIPALVAFGLVSLAGMGGGSDPVRQAILLVLYSLLGAPILGLLAVPICWPVLFVLVVRGWAGATSAVVTTLAIGLPAIHFGLHGDLTTETPAVVPHLVVALTLQGLVGWAFTWGLLAGCIQL